jgi:hypothetical protein
LFSPLSLLSLPTAAFQYISHCVSVRTTTDRFSTASRATIPPLSSLLSSAIVTLQTHYYNLDIAESSPVQIHHLHHHHDHHHLHRYRLRLLFQVSPFLRTQLQGSTLPDPRLLAALRSFPG